MGPDQDPRDCQARHRSLKSTFQLSTLDTCYSCPPGPNPKRSSFSRLAGRPARRCARVRAALRGPGVRGVGGGVRRARPVPALVPCPCLPASPYAYPVAHVPQREILGSTTKSMLMYAHTMTRGVHTAD
eukprot:4983454-Prymnesium_polylepis.2